MADRKISDLTALTTPASGDYLPIVDISEAAAASKNKRITIEELMRGVPDGTAAAPGIAFETYPSTGIYSPGANQLAVATNGTGRLFVDADGRILVGTSSSTNAAASCKLLTNGNSTEIRLTNASGNPKLELVRQEALAGGGGIGSIEWKAYDSGTTERVGASITGQTDGNWASGDCPSRLVFSTTSDSASSPTERMRITSDGEVFIGGTNNAFNAKFVVIGGSSVGDCQAGFGGSNGGSFTIYHADAAGANAANTVAVIFKVNATGRSINAAGTVNASGADYAEYMTKAGDFTIAKGDVCGVTANGQLTNYFADAVSFVVKSTNPSYVGGDTWGSDDTIGPKPDAENTEALAQWKADLETARQQVDRIAFAGQVPVNVMGATPGQYIVPAETAGGGLEGVAKNEADLTFIEYMRAVGKVIAIEDDGRARIIVKVA
jgi:hypothetical protein